MRPLQLQLVLAHVRCARAPRCATTSSFGAHGDGDGAGRGVAAARAVARRARVRPVARGDRRAADQLRASALHGAKTKHNT